MSARERSAAEVEFFYCCSCPWTYLAFVRLQETTMRTAARIVWRPILVEWVHGAATRTFPGSRVDPNSSKSAYQAKDLQDWSRFAGVEIRQPAAWPITPEYAQCAAILAGARNSIVPFLAALFRAYFSDSRNIAEPAVVQAIAAALGLWDETFAREVQAADTRAQLRRNCDELLARGGFGSPTMFIGNDMYFGNDRLPLVEFALTMASEQRLIVPGAHSQQ
jgi:2-hydroxychromene-2-carboxylate isomerase